MTGDDESRQQHRLDDQRAVDALLAEAGCGEDAELRDLLLQLRSLRTDEVPEPSAELAALLAASGTVARLDPGRPRRNRRFAFTALGVAASLGVAGGAAAGNEDLRRGAEGTVTSIFRSFAPPAPPTPAAPEPGPRAPSPATPAVVPASPETLPASVPAVLPGAEPPMPDAPEISGPADDHTPTFHQDSGREAPDALPDGQREQATPAVPARDSRQPVGPPAAGQPAELKPDDRPGRNGNGEAVPGPGQPSGQPEEPGDKTNPSR